MSDDLLRGLLEGIGDDDDKESSGDFNVGGFKDLSFKNGKKKRKPSRTVKATEAVAKSGRENDQMAKDLAARAKPILNQLKDLLKEAVRRRHKFWSLVEVEMDLGEPMSLSYDPESEEVLIFEDEDEE